MCRLQLGPNISAGVIESRSGDDAKLAYFRTMMDVLFFWRETHTNLIIHQIFTIR